MWYNIKKENTEMVNMKKLILIVILALTAVSCELFSPSRWAEYEKYRAERGIECYRRYDGNMYCKDRDGNRVY